MPGSDLSDGYARVPGRSGIPVAKILRQPAAFVASILLCISSAGAQSSAVSEESGPSEFLTPETQNGVRFVSGGVGDGERAAMERLERDYNLVVVFSAPSGAFLSGIRFTLKDDAGERLVETETRGPILLAQLEPGRYVLDARASGRVTERRAIVVPADKEPVRVLIKMRKFAASS